MEDKKFEYDVALSYAREDKKFVDCVAEQLRQNGLKLYYDEYAKIDQWGKNLYDHLSNVYRNEARYCILFISRHYKAKSWTQLERINAQARAITENREYILPFRLDDTEITGLPSTISYLSKEDFNCKQLADAIICKLDSNPTSSLNTNRQRHSFLKISDLVFGKVSLSTVALVITGFTAIELRDRLTPMDTLAKRIHEKSKLLVKGSICKDGWFSRSRGPGTCSYHMGVKKPYDSVVYTKTMTECIEEAKKISWLSP